MPPPRKKTRTSARSELASVVTVDDGQATPGSNTPDSTSPQIEQFNASNYHNITGKDSSVISADCPAATNAEHSQNAVFAGLPAAAATDADKTAWQGFCEIESDPAYFNVMLTDFGVRGVRVREVLGLDEAMLAMLPQPVYGIIFCFRYQDDSTRTVLAESRETGNEEDRLSESYDDIEATKHVWFANQLFGNSCATLALLNIVNNIHPSSEAFNLGSQLEDLKTFTADFSPFSKGEQFMHYPFLKRIHNSFARKMDMLNADLWLKDRVVEAKKRARRKSKKADEGDEQTAFHFEAFVPLSQEVWQLDGLERLPRKVGDFAAEGWLATLSAHLATRVAQHEPGQIEFNLLALVKDPLIEARQDLMGNIKALLLIEDRLTQANADWKAFVCPDAASTTSTEEVLQGPSDDFGITSAGIGAATPPGSTMAKLKDLYDPQLLMQLRQDTITSQKSLRRVVGDELAAAEEDQRKAEDRRQDYGPMIRRWLGMLAENKSESEEGMSKLTELVRMLELGALASWKETD